MLSERKRRSPDVGLVRGKDIERESVTERERGNQENAESGDEKTKRPSSCQVEQWGTEVGNPGEKGGFLCRVCVWGGAGAPGMVEELFILLGQRRPEGTTTHILLLLCWGRREGWRNNLDGLGFLAGLRAALILNAGQAVPAPPPVALSVLQDLHHTCLVDGVDALLARPHGALLEGLSSL